MVPLRRPRSRGPARSAVRFAVAGALTAAVLAAPADADGVRRAAPGISAQATDASALGPGTAVRELLDRRAVALLRRDRKAFLDTVDPASPSLRRDQGKFFDGLAPVPLASWSYAFDPARSRPLPAAPAARYGAQTYVPLTVFLNYRLRGYDAQSVSLPTFPTFVRRPSGWFLGSESDLDGTGLRAAHELWDFGDVVTVTGRSTLVLAHRSSAFLAELAAAADRVVPVVSKAWGGDWSRRVVIVVPDSEAELHRLLGADRDVSALAAVSTAWSDPGAGNSPIGQRILINPTTFGRLSGTGRSVVLAHEVTHLAVRAATAPGTPSWVVEGFADYVGYSAANVPVRRAAAELAGELRAGRLPAGLPADARFAGGPRLAQAYEEAWLAFRFIAERAGPSAPARFYRAAAAPARCGDPVTGALATVLGTTPHGFTAAWQRYLTEQLR